MKTEAKKIYEKQWRLNNLEHVKAWQKQYRIRNLAKKKAYETDSGFTLRRNEGD